MFILTKPALLWAALFICNLAWASTPVNDSTDNPKKYPDKINHAEPLYIDLIRDLGARKGEKEWNFATGLTDKLNFDEYEALVEYEWAPVNRLGLEIEVPFTFFSPNNRDTRNERPSHRIESLKTAIQWSFLVKKKWGTSMALGYINELEFIDLDKMAFSNLVQGNVFNPFLVIAKKWGQSFHTLIYTGPAITQHFDKRQTDFNYQINSNLHYLLPNTRHFIGVELNKKVENADFEMVIRPQMRLEITEQVLVGIVGGIPVSKVNERFSTFVRLIYEPRHKKQH